MSNSYGQYIEELRLSRNVSKEYLLKDIMSDRQYRRYISNESQMSNSKFLQLVDRLGIGSFNFASSYESDFNKDLKHIKNAYKFIRERNYEKAIIEHKKINILNLISEFQIKHYYYNDITINYEIGEFNRLITIQKYSGNNKITPDKIYNQTCE